MRAGEELNGKAIGPVLKFARVDWIGCEVEAMSRE